MPRQTTIRVGVICSVGRCSSHPFHGTGRTPGVPVDCCAFGFGWSMKCVHNDAPPHWSKIRQEPETALIPLCAE